MRPRRESASCIRIWSKIIRKLWARRQAPLKRTARSTTPVTDLVRHTDAAARADYHRSLRDPTGRKLIRSLRVAE